MSDAPLGPDWWLAGDGKWYPSPPGLTDGASARPPTPAPDHDPIAPVTARAPFSAGVYRAGRAGAPEVEEPATRGRRRSLVLAVVATILVVALIAGVTAFVSGHSARQASSNDPAYQQTIVDLLGSERTNIVFLQTFWEDYQSHLAGGGPGSSSARSMAPAGSQAIDAGWLDDMQAQVDQFADDLVAIDETLDERPWPDGTIADEIRDLARSHYQTWQRWANDVPELARQWIAARSTVDLETYIEDIEPQLGNAIDQTFRSLCAVLTDTAPEDGRFDATIADICQD